ncbi:hypothetical protein HGH92_26535 [Chitinophaga varians]|uniref:Uncharacterized protein n=1 Tax=Chitinophaga varians TaxID=2202339 RepID=A0A847RQB7_9BACT|nr:DUF6520 family protein [Chitinophaga varians]NLR67890.1 hypothetical protein [Chitinophaga varians]
MKTTRVSILAAIAVVIAVTVAFAKHHAAPKMAPLAGEVWFQYHPASSGPSDENNYTEISSTSCTAGNTLCAIKVKKDPSTGLPDATDLANVQSLIAAGQPVANRVVFKNQ